MEQIIDWKKTKCIPLGSSIYLNCRGKEKEEFKKKLSGLLENGIKELTLDLSKVEMVDSVGLGVIIATYNSLNKKEGKLEVINVSEEIYGLFKAMRLDQHFEVQPAK